MPSPLDQNQIDTIERYDSTQRFNYLLKEVVANQQIWILTDEHGCVMLNTEEEDCIPVWPNEEFAKAWATGEWVDCKAQGIALSKWHSHWSGGLAEDDLAIVVFPNENEEGLVVFPDELDFELKRVANKRK
ncbi:MAG: hypothetical protein ACI9FJ_003225 [Alteromonadaceae bacterium]|jgi:hypothetical protein